MYAMILRNASTASGRGSGACAVRCADAIKALAGSALAADVGACVFECVCLRCAKDVLQPFRMRPRAYNAKALASSMSWVIFVPLTVGSSRAR